MAAVLPGNVVNEHGHSEEVVPVLIVNELGLAAGASLDAAGYTRVVLYKPDLTEVGYDPVIEIKGDVRPTFAVLASPDYTDGMTVGGLITLTNFAKSDGGSGTMTRFCIESTIPIAVDTYLHIFCANPADSTFTDGQAAVLHANDKLKKIITIELLSSKWRPPKGVDAVYSIEAINPGDGRILVPFTVTSGRNLYVAWETNGTINFGATTNVNMIVGTENV